MGTVGSDIISLDMQPVVKEGKEFSIEDDKGIREVIIRSKVGVFMGPAYSKTLEDQGTTKLFDGSANLMVQDSKGRFLIVASSKKVVAVDLQSKKTVFETSHTYVHHLELSPGQNFLQIFDKQDASKGETRVFSLPEFKEVCVFKEGMSSLFISKENYPLGKFTSDDKLIFRYNSKCVEAYNTQDFKLVSSLPTDTIKFFKLAPRSTIDAFFLVTIVLDDKSNSGKMTIYNQKSLEKGTHHYVKNIDKAEEVKIKFNPTSSDFLIEVQTYFDTTGKSYYGEYGLYFFNSKEKRLSQVRTYEGPIHDFSWDPTGAKFIVISGFMPANSVMFNNLNEPLLEFGKHHKNTIYWNPQGRFVCLAGYGNLNGEMEVWDVDESKKVGIMKSNSASYCLWSPDGRKMLTAVVTPRLRVDNDYKVFSYSGASLKAFDMSWTELYEVIWRSSLQFKSDRRGASPDRLLNTEEKAKEKRLFRPVGSSSITNAILNADTSNSNQGRILTKHQKFEVSHAPAPSNAPVIMNQFPLEEEKPKKKKKKNKEGV